MAVAFLGELRKAIAINIVFSGSIYKKAKSVGSGRPPQIGHGDRVLLSSHLFQQVFECKQNGTHAFFESHGNKLIQFGEVPHFFTDMNRCGFFTSRKRCFGDGKAEANIYGLPFFVTEGIP